MAIHAGLATVADIRSVCAELAFAALRAAESVAVAVAVAEGVLVVGVAFCELDVTAGALAGDHGGGVFGDLGQGEEGQGREEGERGDHGD